MEIVERRENALLKRVEIEFIIRHENQPTPTRKAMTEWLNKLEPGSKKELVVIKDVTTRFGRAQTTGIGLIYQDAQALSVEPKYVHNKLSALNPAAEESSDDEGGESSE